MQSGATARRALFTHSAPNMSDQEIRFRIVVEDNAAPAAARTDAAFQRVGASAADASRQTTAAMRMLPAQLSDVATQLAGGQNPFLVLTQQGLQTRDMFGSFSLAARGITAAVSPAVLGVSATAGAMGLLAYAAAAGYRESQALTRQLLLNGGAAGKTAGDLDTMARSLAQSANVGIGQTREVMTELAASGAFVGQNMDLAGQSAIALQKLSGRATGEIVKDLASMSQGVAQWALAHNRAYNYLSVAQFKAIQQFEAQGRVQDAVRLNLQAFGDAMQTRANRATENLGYLETAWVKVGNVARGAWDAMLDQGREKSLDRKIDEARGALENALRRGEEGAKYNPATGRMMQSSRDQVAAMRMTLDALLKQKEGERLAGEERVKTQQDTQRKLQQSTRGFVDAKLGLDAARQAKELAALKSDNEAQQLVVDQAWRERSITAAKYTDTMIDLARKRSDADIQASAKAYELETRRVAEKPEDGLAIERAKLQAESAIIAKLGERVKLEAEIEAGKFRTAPDGAAETPLEAFRRQELAVTAAAEQGMGERRQAAMLAAIELVSTNAALNADLIKDDRARAFAQFDIEAQALARQLNLSSLYGEDRRRVEADLAQWRVLRERQLTEQLKPEWQRNAELWGDTMRDMRQRYDTFLDGFVSSGRDAFLRWALEGRISSAGLASFIRSQFATLLYERYLSGYVQQIGGAIFSMFLGGGTGGAGVIAGGGGLRLPGRANGGGVDAGGAYLIGERGPEVLLMGRTPGTVVPNHALASVGGSTAQPQLIQHFHLRGNEDHHTLHALANMAGDRAVATMVNKRARGAVGY